MNLATDSGVLVPVCKNAYSSSSSVAQWPATQGQARVNAWLKVLWWRKKALEGLGRNMGILAVLGLRKQRSGETACRTHTALSRERQTLGKRAHAKSWNRHISQLPIQGGPRNR